MSGEGKTLKIEIKGIKELIKDLDPKKVRRPMKRALKEVARRGKSRTKQRMAREYTLKSGRIGRAIKVNWPTLSHMEATLIFPGKTPGLQNYKAREKRGVVSLSISKHGGLAARKGKRKSKQQGVTVEVKKGQRKSVKGGFLATPNSGVGIFKRRGKERYPIDRLAGPSVMGMFNSIDGYEILNKVVGRNFSKIFWHEYKRELKK